MTFGYREIMDLEKDIQDERNRMAKQNPDFKDDPRYKQLTKLQEKIHAAWWRVIDILDKADIELIPNISDEP